MHLTYRTISMTSQMYFHRLVFPSMNRLKSFILQWDFFSSSPGQFTGAKFYLSPKSWLLSANRNLGTEPHTYLWVVHKKIHTHLIASLVERPGSVGDSVTSLQGFGNEGVVLPALELSEGAEVGVGVVKTNLEVGKYTALHFWIQSVIDLNVWSS